MLALVGRDVALCLHNMLKITHVEQPAATLRLEGEVSGPWVAELRRVCADLLGNNGHPTSHLVLDLAGVSFLDPEGIVLFQDLARHQVRFTSGSLFVAEQLKGVADVHR